MSRSPLCVSVFLTSLLTASALGAADPRKSTNEGPPPPPPPSPVCSAGFFVSSPGGTVTSGGYEALVGQPVQFSVEMRPTVPCQFLWIFGDGYASNDYAGTSHTYSTPGTYAVAATASMTGTSFVSYFTRVFHITETATVPHTAVVGAGVAGPWDTALTIANPSGSPMPYVVADDPNLSPGSAGCPDVTAGCGIASGIIAPQTFVQVNSLKIRGHAAPPPGIIYVAGATLGSIPAVSAMIFEGDRCGRSASLPVVGPLETLFSDAPLTFGGAEISPCAHSNLLLIPAPGSSEPTSVGVLVEDSSGERIQVENLTGAPGQTIFVDLGDPFLGLYADAALVTVTSQSGGPFAAIVTVVAPQGVRVLSPDRNALSNSP